MEMSTNIGHMDIELAQTYILGDINLARRNNIYLSYRCGKQI